MSQISTFSTNCKMSNVFTNVSRKHRLGYILSDSHHRPIFKSTEESKRNFVFFPVAIKSYKDFVRSPYCIQGLNDSVLSAGCFMSNAVKLSPPAFSKLLLQIEVTGTQNSAEVVYQNRTGKLRYSAHYMQCKTVNI